MADATLQALYSETLELLDALRRATDGGPAWRDVYTADDSDTAVAMPPATGVTVQLALNQRSLALLEQLTPLVALTASAMGECRMSEPYAPMRPVRQPNGDFQWCCTHDPEHCG